MIKILHKTEKNFEKLTGVATFLLGNSVVFLIAVSVVVYWLTDKHFRESDMHSKVGDVILGITFISLFIIQKTNNRFAAALHLKIDELIASHENARNSVIGIESKTEIEIIELSKEYAELAEEVKELKEEEEIIENKITVAGFMP